MNLSPYKYKIKNLRMSSIKPKISTGILLEVDKILKENIIQVSQKLRGLMFILGELVQISEIFIRMHLQKISTKKKCLEN